MRPIRLLTFTTPLRVLASVLALSAALGSPARSQGTLVYDFEPGAGISGNGYIYGEGAALRDRLVLGAQVQGDLELWISDGTTAGTQLVRDIHPTESSAPRQFTPFGDYVAFTCKSPSGFGLWRTDGTAAGTLPLTQLGPTQSFTHLTPVGTQLYFHRSGPGGSQLWTTDGTPAGTRLLCAIPAPYGEPPRFLELDGSLLFTVWTTGAGGNFALWKTDGTSEATASFATLPFEASNPADFTRLGSRFFFSCMDVLTGRELWVTDGTTAGTKLFANLVPGSGSLNPKHLRVLDNGLMVFRDEMGLFGPPNRVWSTDGTIARTQVIVSDPLFPVHMLASAGSVAYFAMFERLGRTDGTAAGVQWLSQDVILGGDAAPLRVGSGDELVFRGRDYLEGDIEPWFVDGAQVLELADVHPGDGDSHPNHFRRAGNRLFFQANDGATGVELHSAPIAQTHAWVGEPFGHGCGDGLNSPRLELDAPATLGSTVHALLSGATPVAPALIYWSLSTMALPIGGGCSVYLAAPQLHGAQFTDPSGGHATALTIPTSSALLGLELYLQELVVIAGGPLLGIGELSSPLELVLGP